MLKNRKDRWRKEFAFESRDAKLVEFVEKFRREEKTLSKRLLLPFFFFFFPIYVSLTNRPITKLFFFI